MKKGLEKLSNRIALRDRFTMILISMKQTQ